MDDSIEIHQSKTQLEQLSLTKQVLMFYDSHSGKSDDLHQMSSLRELMPYKIHRTDVLNANVQQVLGHSKGQEHISIL